MFGPRLRHALAALREAGSVAVGQFQEWAAAKLPFISDNDGSNPVLA